MKAIVKQLVTISLFAFLFLVGNVKAEETETVVANKEETETPLQMENWMTDEMIWSTSSKNILGFPQETESTPEVENMMIDNATWNLNNTANDPELKVESWMTNENFWI